MKVAVSTLLFLALVVPPAQAQRFHGKGQQTTDLFALNQGLAIFDVEHRGSGAFSVTLLDEKGIVIGELADGSDIFAGSKAMRIPQYGRYLLNVSAGGEWEVRVRAGNEPNAFRTVTERAAYDTGSIQGAAEAAREGTFGWLAKGFVGGLLGGPIGTGIAVNRAGKSITVLPPSSPADLDPFSYKAGYTAAFESRLKTRRQRSALIGGLLGTGVLLAIILQAVDLDGAAGDNSTGPQPTPNSIVPVRN